MSSRRWRVLRQPRVSSLRKRLMSNAPAFGRLRFEIRAGIICRYLAPALPETANENGRIAGRIKMLSEGPAALCEYASGARLRQQLVEQYVQISMSAEGVGPFFDILP